MVDLIGQFKNIEEELRARMDAIYASAKFINGPDVTSFKNNLSAYLDCEHVIPCANGTDALQIALMALDLQEGDEVILPAFTYAATAEVVCLLKLKPVMVDVDPDSFNTSWEYIEPFITERTRVIMPVHLFGQTANIEKIVREASSKGISVIEDNAQAIGAKYTFSDGTKRHSGTIGDIGCTSFFPSKNLGCFGDGGAIFTRNEALATKLTSIANHGQSSRYYHDRIGVNSRLDSMQAAVLDVKLKHLNDYIKARNNVANNYDRVFKDLDWIETPLRVNYSEHVFHQYTLKIGSEKREALKTYLEGHGIPSMIYYPVPLYDQKAFKNWHGKGRLNNTENLCKSVLSLPIHTEMTPEIQDRIIGNVLEFGKSQGLN